MSATDLPAADLGLVAELVLEHAYGAREVVGTDCAWRVGRGGVRRNSLYDGYEVDLRDEPHGWDRAGVDDSGWVRRGCSTCRCCASSRGSRRPCGPWPRCRAWCRWVRRRARCRTRGRARL
ncbi:alpha-L-rhamnosidase N-terminal domain-containing protein [Miniimonas arenae]|uniref:alpha-L-rhamnosidase N-terminal domain-containing protein n=1 Tax=Miniimonas arenae TaxID=676201 RepID=UPI0015D5BF37